MFIKSSYISMRLDFFAFESCALWVNYNCEPLDRPQSTYMPTLLALANSDADNDVSCLVGDRGEAANCQSSSATASGGHTNNAMVQYLIWDTLTTLSHWLLTFPATTLSKDSLEFLVVFLCSFGCEFHEDDLCILFEDVQPKFSTHVHTYLLYGVK